MKALNLSRRLLAWLSLWQLCLLAACVAPHYDVRSIHSDGIGPPPLVRLHDVAFPLLVAAADWCVVEQEPTYGFSIMEIGLSKRHVGAEGGSRVSVVYVHPQSPGALAGLNPRDELIHVNERPVDELRAEEVSQVDTKDVGGPSL